MHLLMLNYFPYEGAIFWPDFWSPRKTIFNIHKNSVLFELTGIDFVDMFEQESGQVLVNRKVIKFIKIKCFAILGKKC